jgi:prepilin-type N-terminal cleavage/methylation domain-containing protein
MVQRIRKVQNEREGGFTLIELLIVIVVLGILAGIVVLGLGSFRQDATTAACKADAKQVQTASDAHIASPTNGPGTPAADVTTLFTEKLLKTDPSVVVPAPLWVYDAATGEVDDALCTP